MFQKEKFRNMKVSQLIEFLSQFDGNQVVKVEGPEDYQVGPKVVFEMIDGELIISHDNY